MKTLLSILLFVFTSCNSQSTLTFVNKSSVDIDSIMIQKPGKVVLGKIAVGQKFSKKLNNIEINTNNEGLFPFSIYQNDKILNGMWGFHDFGMLASNNEIFYIFDNGISSSEAPLQKPKELVLYFYNTTSQRIDSIFNSNDAIIKVNELTPRSFEVVYEYGKIENTKVFEIAIGGKKRSSKINHDFSNWNNNQTNLYFENDSIKPVALPWREPLEFIVDLQVNLPAPSDSVIIESPALVKTYYYHQPKYLKIIFDFKKLKENPFFIVTVAGKRYKADLSAHDFSNIYSNQKIFFLEEKGIRSLTD